MVKLITQQMDGWSNEGLGVSVKVIVIPLPWQSTGNPYTAVHVQTGAWTTPSLSRSVLYYA